MDNDDKVKNNELQNVDCHKEVLFFLNDKLAQLQQSGAKNSYNLEEEFAKTKKNHKWSIKIILLAAVLVVAGLTVLISFYEIKKNRQLTVSLDSFSDLNLKNVIDTVTSVQTNYENSVKAKSSLESKKNMAQNNAKIQYENEVFILDSLKLKNKKDYDERLAKINESYDQSLKSIDAEYDFQILEVEKQIAEYKSQMEQFDSSKLKAVEEQKRILDSERALFQLEQQQTVELYENQIKELENTIQILQNTNSDEIRTALSEMITRYEAEIALYDPVIKDQKGKEIIAKANLILQNETEALAATETQTEENKTASESTQTQIDLNSVSEIKDFYSDYEYLEKILTALPHKNSLLRYINASKTLSEKMCKVLTETSNNLKTENDSLRQANQQLFEKNQKTTEELNAARQETEVKLQQQKNEMLSENQKMYESLLLSLKAQAVILNASSADKITVYVSDSSRESIGEDGCAAEIKVGRTTIKGTVIKNSENQFIFAPDSDKNGNPVEIDLSQLFFGTVVKLK